MRKSPKILYAIQGTGNGHVARAREVIPILQSFGHVDVLLSGDQSAVKLPIAVKYKSKGLTFIYNRSGGLSYFKTLLKNNLYHLYKEVKSFPVEDYDIVINDFEFTTAWACKFKGKKCFALSHQASFFSKNSPRPKRKSLIGELVLKYYAPSDSPIAFHFDRFDAFIHYPVIRGEVRNGKATNKGHYVVYLPAYGDDYIFNHLKMISNLNWIVFSKYANKHYQKANVSFRPIDNNQFLKYFLSCEGILTSAGFETPAEAMYLGKKLFVIPIKNQYEQYCNAEALRQMGVAMALQLNHRTVAVLQDWVYSNKTITVINDESLHTILKHKVFYPQSFGVNSEPEKTKNITSKEALAN